MSIESKGYCGILSPFGILKKNRKLNASGIDFNKNLNGSLFNLQVNLCSKLGEIKEIKNKGDSEIPKSIMLYVSNKWGTVTDNSYFSESHRIVRHSNAYLLRHIWKIEKHYATEFTERKMNRLIHSIVYKLNIGDNKIDQKRKWLQAPAPKCRSLSIPSLTDRVIASMWTELLELYLRGSMGVENHAYQKSRGTLTAWKELLNSLLKKNWKYIYEFDLENFFPSVDHRMLVLTLKDLGIPTWTVSMLLSPLINKPSISLDLECKDYQSNKVSVFFKSLYEMINYKGESNYVFKKSSLIGVPMGLGYSPLLATLVLIRQLNIWKDKSNDYITYGDDGILFTNNLNDIKKFQVLLSNGKVKLNKAKSQWFKFDFHYVGTLKFLGLRWDPIKDRLYADTRKGSKLEMIRYLMELPVAGQKYLSILWNFYIKYSNSYKLRVIEFENFYFQYVINHRMALKFNVFGLLLSKVYQGSYEDIEYEIGEKSPLPESYLMQIIGNKNSISLQNGSSLTIAPVYNKISSIRKMLKSKSKNMFRIHNIWEKQYLKALYKEKLMDLIPWEAGEYLELYELEKWNRIYLRQIGRRNFEKLIKHVVNEEIDFRRGNIVNYRKIETPKFIAAKVENEDEYCWTYKGFDLVRVKKWY